jgi:hypothetical protein
MAAIPVFGSDPGSVIFTGWIIAVGGFRWRAACRFAVQDSLHGGKLFAKVILVKPNYAHTNVIARDAGRDEDGNVPIDVLIASSTHRRSEAEGRFFFLFQHANMLGQLSGFHRHPWLRP